MEKSKTAKKVDLSVKEKSPRSKRELLIESGRAIGALLYSLLLGTREMAFGTTPLGFALLAASGRDAPLILLGVAASALRGGELSIIKLISAFLTAGIRIFASYFLDKKEKEHIHAPALSKKMSLADLSQIFAQTFSEHKYLRMMSASLGVFLIGIVTIVRGGFRFYDLFGAILYLVLTPAATWIFSHYFDIIEQKRARGKAFSMPTRDEVLFETSRTALASALTFSLGSASVAGISLSLLTGCFLTLLAARRGILRGVLTGIALGLACSPTHAVSLALCAIAYASLSRISVFGAGLAGCISGLVWSIYADGTSALATAFPALLCATMTFCTAQRINAFEDISHFFAPGRCAQEQLFNIDTLIAEKRALTQEERLRSISDSFSSLSEIFYNLSSKLKRPTTLDLRRICEENFEAHCAACESRELCYGAEYGATLDVMKKMTVALHTTGRAQLAKLPESFKIRCRSAEELVENVNHACAVATKKAFQNEKTEIIALDYDAIAKILNDAIAEGEEEFRIDPRMSKKLSKIIADEGFGEHSVTVFGKRKLKILARGLDLCDMQSDVSVLRGKLEEACSLSLADPTFELSFGSVNMQTEARRAFSADTAFSTSAGGGEKICGDAVSIFENKCDYLYALISDGMGKGQGAALVSEMCCAFLRNMLGAGNRMETSLRMLNSVIRAKGKDSEAECSATVDLLRFDLYTGALTLVKSGAAPTFVLRRGNVFKLSSPSFPIGILRAIDAKQIDISCEDGDLVVMISDGATRGGDDVEYLYEMLREPTLCNDSASKIADRIIRRARAECDTPPDDISVVVLKVKKEVCNW